MRNRRILEGGTLAVGRPLEPVIDADSVAALSTHAGHGWSRILAHTRLESFGVPPGRRAIVRADDPDSVRRGAHCRC